MLKVSLLRFNRLYLINKNERDGLMKLIQIVKKLIFEQRKMKSISSSPKERKYKTDTCSSIDLKNPRKKASAFPVYTKSRLAVPDDISKSNVHEMLQPLENDLKVLTQFEENTNILGTEFHDKKYYNKTEEYEVLFETGSEVLVKWTKGEIGNSGWRPGWFLAEVQDSSLAND